MKCDTNIHCLVVLWCHCQVKTFPWQHKQKTCLVLWIFMAPNTSNDFGGSHWSSVQRHHRGQNFHLKSNGQIAMTFTDNIHVSCAVRRSKCQLWTQHISSSVRLTRNLRTDQVDFNDLAAFYLATPLGSFLNVFGPSTGEAVCCFFHPILLYEV